SSFSFHDPPTPAIYTLSLHDALPILKVQTRKSNLYFAQAARTNVFRGEEPVDVQRSLFQTEDYIQQVLACGARAGEPVRVEKMVDRKSTRLNSSHLVISYAVFCLKKK